MWPEASKQSAFVGWCRTNQVACRVTYNGTEHAKIQHQCTTIKLHQLPSTTSFPSPFPFNHSPLLPLIFSFFFSSPIFLLFFLPSASSSSSSSLVLSLFEYSLWQNLQSLINCKQTTNFSRRRVFYPSEEIYKICSLESFKRIWEISDRQSIPLCALLLLVLFS